ncbi:MAG: hypothetical protein ACOY3Z_03465 [Thermodesulfobacteriota bacterium]
MKKSASKFENMMTAITFAEEGEFDTAMAFLPRCEMKLCSWLEKFSMAATFAEEGMHDEAMRMSGMGKPDYAILEKLAMAVAFAEEGMHDEAMRIGEIKKRPSCGCCEIFLDTLGLSEAPMKFGLVPTPCLSGAR